MPHWRVNIFITGATGYISGSVLGRLLKHPRAADFNIVALVRSREKAMIIRSKFRVNAVVGTLDEHDKLTGLAERADIVFSVTDSDDLGAMRAILRGMKNKYERTGDMPTLIHTSGTGFLTDDAMGMYASDKVYHDSQPKEIESLPDTAFHRNVDLAILEADQAGFVRALIVTPPVIFGMASGPLFENGLSNRHSIQIPLLIKTSLARGQAGMIGEGKPIWNHAHVNDVADFYIVLLNAVLADPNAVPHGREGFYILENGEHSWYELGRALGKALVELGVSKSAEPTSFTDHEIDKYIGNSMVAHLALGSNARGRGEQARALGWKPKYTTADMLASIKPEVKAILRENRQNLRGQGLLLTVRVYMKRAIRRTGSTRSISAVPA
ncbi:NAD-P-binding protein [Cubamyces menziesii]|nr:NAD-P-binding protein [Cubamyces menziesii]